MTSLLLIEDDYFVIEWTRRLLEEHFGGMSIQLVEVHTESEFVARKQELAALSAVGVIVDLMLPWEDGTTPENTLEPRGDLFEAGLRILQDIAEHHLFRNVPALLYTVNDLPAQRIQELKLKLKVQYLRKDEPDERLVDWIRKVLRKD